MLSLSIIKPVTTVKKLCPHFQVYRQSCNSSTESSMRPARWWRKRWCWQQLRTDCHFPAMQNSDQFWNCGWTAAVFFPQIQALPTASVQDFHVHLLHRWFLSKHCRRKSASRRKLSLVCRKSGLLSIFVWITHLLIDFPFLAQGMVHGRLPRTSFLVLSGWYFSCRLLK